MDYYDVVRKFRDTGRKYTILRHQTLEEAQAHCSHPDSSSNTCTTKTGVRRTATKGPWFDVYYPE